MKNVDFKKLFILIAIIVIIAVVILLVVNFSNKDKLTKEETQKIEDISIKYYANLTEGYTTVYGGLDILYQRKETTTKNLETVEILNTSIKYASDNSFDTSVSDAKVKALEASKKYKNISEYALYNGESVRKAITELFGDIKYVDSSANNNHNFIYDYIYDSNNDVYLVKRNNNDSQVNTNQGINYKLLSTKEKDEKVIVTIAIAYTCKVDANTMYAKDPEGEKIIAENVEEFPEDKIDEFDKYEITLKKSSDNKYVFESIKKVK
ncbi:MAG: hypothetical protein ACI4XM_01015 [Candidatus Coprovivens sp.]